MKLILRAWLHICRLWVLWQIDDMEGYLRDCERSGITGSLMLREFRGQLGAMRVRLADIEAALWPNQSALGGRRR